MAGAELIAERDEWDSEVVLFSRDQRWAAFCDAEGNVGLDWPAIEEMAVGANGTGKAGALLLLAVRDHERANGDRRLRRLAEHCLNLVAITQGVPVGEIGSRMVEEAVEAVYAADGEG